MNARRPTSDGFYRSAFWRRRSAEVIARDVTCQVGGCAAPCTDADHIVPREAGGSDDLDNLLGLCRRHHSAKTAARDGGFGNPRGGGL